MQAVLRYRKIRIGLHSQSLMGDQNLVEQEISISCGPLSHICESPNDQTILIDQANERSRTSGVDSLCTYSHLQTGLKAVAEYLVSVANTTGY